MDIYGYDRYLKKWLEYKVDKIEYLSKSDIRIYSKSGRYLCFDCFNKAFLSFYCFGKELNKIEKSKLKGMMK